MAVPNLPTTLKGWYKLMIRLDCQWRQAMTERKMFAICGSGSTGAQTGAMQCTGQQGNTQWQVQPVQRDPNAMQVDQNHGPLQCYNCGQTGHMA
ncbi:hypothetical protein AMATHDRAFT_161122 [Amanita thiersii Skay4041]|uniref:CCHC-type domain-containing protein n=1 Tax=Amanita thiersii Skay4041 TaxID=703135 RepID=A0A2A9N7A9_9AGAR|nr:hypothetical protein AMATHDRAFT_161122 [Amanita thiersii Skay4041]